MKISELKKEFTSQSESLAAAYGYSSTKPYVGTINLTFEFKNHTISFRKIDGVLLHNHYLISVGEEYLSDMPFSEKEKEFLQKQFTLAISYWKKHAEKNKVSGLLIFTEKNTIKSFVNLIQEQFPVPENLLDHLHYEINFKSFSNHIVLGGFLNNSYIERVKKYNQALKLLTRVIDSEPLLRVSMKNHAKTLYSMFNSGMLQASYYHDKFFLYFNETFDKLHLTYGFSNSPKGDRVMNLAEEDIIKHLREIQDENSLVTLMKHPMDNFTELVKSEIYFEHYEATKEAFENLEEQLGSWEEVESESSYLIDHSKAYKVSDISNNKTSCEAAVYRTESKKRTYFFVRINGVRQNALKVFPIEQMPELDAEQQQKFIPKEVKQYVFDFIWND